MTTCAPV